MSFHNHVYFISTPCNMPLFFYRKLLLKLFFYFLFISSLLSVSSRPSAQKQASWLCGSVVWKSPTKTSRSPRKTSCTRSRRAHRRGFTFNLQNFYIFLTLTPSLHPHPAFIYRCVKERRQQLSCLSPQREFWYILCMSCLAYPTLLLPLRVKTINKRTKKIK